MNKKEIKEIKKLHLEAFERLEGPIIEELVEELLLRKDSISLSIREAEKIIGNIIYSPFKLLDYPEKKCYLLAPLGVLPRFQGKGIGIGEKLIIKGKEHLKNLDVDAIFVLGHPNYYNKKGFMISKMETPYKKLMKTPEAWMVMEIKKESIKGINSRTEATKPMMKSIFWDTSNR